MQRSSVLEKVRFNKPRPPEATPKELVAWENFLLLIKEFCVESGDMPEFVLSELNRLADKGNPLAIRLQERVDILNFKPRKAHEKPLPPPAPRRISRVKWGVPEG